MRDARGFVLRTLLARPRRRSPRDALVALAVGVVAVGASLGLSMLLILAVGASPTAAVWALVSGAFGTRQALAATLLATIPLTLVALGWIVALSTRRINIGFEGQILMGGTLAAYAGMNLGSWPKAVHLPLAVLAGGLAGGVFAGIAALLWRYRHVNEIISTLLLNFIAANIVAWLVNGPLQEPTHSVPFSRSIAASAAWPSILGGTNLTADVLLVPVSVFLVWALLARSRLGFSLRLAGANPRAARLAGHDPLRMSVVALVVSGCLAGLAGSSLVLGAGSSALSSGFSSGYGFDGIVVALMARNRLAAVIPSAVLLAALQSGSPFMEAQAGVSAQLAILMQGLVVLFVTVAGVGSELGLGRRIRRLGELVRNPITEVAA